MKGIIKLENVPENCLKCKISFYETCDAGEYLFCPLVEKDGGYLARLPDCPIEEVQE